MHNPIIFLFGYKTIRADMSCAAKILNLCGAYGIPYISQRTDDESFYIECSLPSATRLLRLCQKNGIEPFSVTPHGLPHLLLAYRRRFGLFLGAIMAVVLIFLSGRFLWDIRIDGERRLTEKEVLDELYACGLKKGMPVSKIDADVIQNRVLIYSDDVSWISINLSGTVAHVEIREADPLPQEAEQPKAANLVATDDGEISGFEEVRGDIAVKIGDFVRTGELLVSGIRDSETLGFTFIPAEGKVFAKVSSEYEVTVPLEYDKKVYSEKVYCEKYLVFFDKQIKIYSNNRNSLISCDIIDTVEYLNVFSLGELPFGVRTVRYLPYRQETVTMSAEEAVDLAFYKMRLVEEERGISDVLSKQLDGTFEENSYRLKCNATYFKNIAKQVELEMVN